MAVKLWRERWVVDFWLHGRRVRRVSPVQTRRGAQTFEREQFNGCSTSIGSSRNTARFADFAKEWLSTYAVTNNRPSEVVSKETTLRVHLIPFLENRGLDAINARLVEEYKATKLKDGLSPKTVNNHLVILRKLLATAVEWELLDRLPVIRRLPVPPAKFNWLTAEESEKLLEAVQNKYPQWFVLFLTGFRTGLRRGELFALAWEDVDLVAGAVTVRRSVYRGKLLAPKGGRERTIPLTPKLWEALRQRQARQGRTTGLIFPDKDGNLSKHQDHVDRPLHGALAAAGLKRIVFHEIRHSFASQLVSAGRSLKEVQELLGHATIQMTLRYAHLAPGRMRDAVSVLEPAPGADKNLEHGWNILQEKHEGPGNDAQALIATP